MTKEDPKFLDETHFTSHFRQVRAFIGLATRRQFCVQLKKLGVGLAPMQRTLNLEPPSRFR